SSLVFFFFQAEDGIRDRNVTGVQTCALPISTQRFRASHSASRSWESSRFQFTGRGGPGTSTPAPIASKSSSSQPSTSGSSGGSAFSSFIMSRLCSHGPCGLLVLGLVLLDGLEGDLPLRLLPVWGLHL